MGERELNCRGVYLIHFDVPYKHARHYLGYASNIGERVIRHEHGDGARLMAVVKQAGITFTVARVWRGATRDDERKLKRGKRGPRLCPIYRAAAGEEARSA